VANLTITVDEDTLRRARIRAVERNESVNAYLAEALRQYAEAAVPESVVIADLARLADEHGVGTAGQGRAWRRDDLHRA
jgi:post-segregation antitoxin (ccd killing protein)